MPSTVSGLWGSSVLINVGAKVPVAGVALRYEPERFLVESLRPSPGWRVLRGEKDWCRAWPTPGEEVGEERMAEMGRLASPLGVIEGEPLENGLFLQVGPLGAGMAMVRAIPKGFAGRVWR
jgi:hypothetical protein